MSPRYIAFVAAFLGISCATRTDSMAPDQGRGVTTYYHGVMNVTVHGSIDPSQHEILAPVDSVWSRLPSVYERLAVETSHLDKIRYRIGNTRFNTRAIGGERLSRYLDCGRSVANAPNADSYRVTMSIVTQVRVGSDSRTVLQTLISATARPRMTGGQAVSCSSKGRLERRIAEMTWEGLEHSIDPDGS